MQYPATATQDLGRLVGSDRVLALLKELGAHPDGVSLEALTRALASPKPTVHRALGALRRAGFATQDARGHYMLGDEFIRIAFSHHEARPDHVRVTPILHALANEFGETAHYAVLDDGSVVYRSKVDAPQGAVRLTSVVGGRNPAHCTGVGKMLLAQQLKTLGDVKQWAIRYGLERRTPQTKTTPRQLHEDLEEARRRGYSLDDQENELGINCIALPVYLLSRSSPSGAISISALAYRTPLDSLVTNLPTIRAHLASITGPS